MIQFDQKEIKYIQDQDFLLTKREIIDKLFNRFTWIGEKIGQHATEHRIEALQPLLERSGKVSKGENYRGLPYLILDFPRNYHKQSVMAYRLMFWWGNFFSATIHLAGDLLLEQRQQVEKNLNFFGQKNVLFCINNTPWDYSMEKNNYIVIKNLEENQFFYQINNHKFIKLSKILPLDKWSELENFAIDSFDDFSIIFKE